MLCEISFIEVRCTLEKKISPCIKGSWSSPLVFIDDSETIEDFRFRIASCLSDSPTWFVAITSPGSGEQISKLKPECCLGGFAYRIFYFFHGNNKLLLSALLSFMKTLKEVASEIILHWLMEDIRPLDDSRKQSFLFSTFRKAISLNRMNFAHTLCLLILRMFFLLRIRLFRGLF